MSTFLNEIDDFKSQAKVEKQIQLQLQTAWLKREIWEATESQWDREKKPESNFFPVLLEQKVDRCCLFIFPLTILI